jgi:hypothetical protein
VVVAGGVDRGDADPAAVQGEVDAPGRLRLGVAGYRPARRRRWTNVMTALSGGDDVRRAVWLPDEAVTFLRQAATLTLRCRGWLVAGSEADNKRQHDGVAARLTRAVPR